MAADLREQVAELTEQVAAIIGPVKSLKTAAPAVLAMVFSVRIAVIGRSMRSLRLASASPELRPSAFSDATCVFGTEYSTASHSEQVNDSAMTKAVVTSSGTIARR